MSTTLDTTTRRSFLRAGVLCYGFSWVGAFSADDKAPPAPAPTLPSPLPGSLKNNPKLNAWINLHPDGTVTMRTGKVELGQGILTALTQIVSDELDVEIASIKVISGNTELTPDEGVTSGSLSIQDSGTARRYACAEVRSMLLVAAGKRLNVGVDTLEVDKGLISSREVSTNSPRSVKYVDLLDSVNYALDATAKVQPKKSPLHKLMGSEIARRDIPGKVSGQPMYVQDLRLPGMVHARVIRPPAPRAVLVGFNKEPIEKLPGVLRVIRDGNFLGVIATKEEQAVVAAHALRAQTKWQTPKDLPPFGAELFEHMQAQKTLDDVISLKGNPAELSSGEDKLFKQRYTRPYIAHASIGPSCALAQWESSNLNSTNHLRVWCHSQGVFPLRNDLSKALRIPKEQITVAHVEGSGCYGHNGADDVALDAALIAKAVPGVPVRLQWMREDEFRWEPYGSPMVVQMAAKLDANGRIAFWHHELWSYTHSTRPYDPDGCNLLAAWYMENPLKAGPSRNIPQPAGGGDRNAIALYDFPNQKVVNHLIQQMPIRTSALRTLGAFCNVLAIESFMDELAIESGQDAVEFRIKHLKDPRAVAVIQQAAKMANWSASNESYNPSKSKVNASNPSPVEKRGRGIAFAKYKNMAVYCAVVAQVVVNTQTGVIKVEKAFACADAGLIINPNGLKNQIEGGLIQATSWSLMERVDYDPQRIKTERWSDYPVLRFSQVPVVEVSLINRPDERSLGVGEGAHGPMAAAIANAIHAASGQRLRDTPFKIQSI